MTDFYDEHGPGEKRFPESLPFYAFDKSDFYVDMGGGTKEEYLNERLYLLSVKQLKTLLRNEDVKTIVDDIAGRHGATKGEVYARICDANDNYGLTPAVFREYDLFSSPKAVNYRQLARKLRKQKRLK